MNLYQHLSRRLHKKEIQDIVCRLQDDPQLREELYQMIFDKDDFVSYQALWVHNHLSPSEVKAMCPRLDILIDAAMSCSHTGKRRLLLNLIYRQSADTTLRVDFLNFCLERMMSKKEPSGIQSVCIKLAYQLTRHFPELQQELFSLLEIMNPEECSPAVRSSQENVLKRKATI